MATLKIRRSWLVAGGAVVVVAWLVWITVSIGQQSRPGAPSLAALATGTQQAINHRDAEALGPLLDYPSKDGPDFAQQYIDALGPTPETVVVSPDERTSMLGVRGQTPAGGPYSYVLRAKRSDDGQWLVSFLPPAQ